MIKKKLIGLISAISLVSVVGIASTVSADDSVAELKYNEELSTPTVKVVDVNYSVSESGLGSFYGKFIADCSEENMEYETLVSFDTDTQYRNEKLTIDWADMSENGEVASSGTHGRLKITVPEGTPEFSVSFTEIAMCSFDGNDEYYPDDITITIPGATVDNSPTPIDAAKLDTYDTYADDAVTAYTAVVPAADVDKTFEWSFKNADGVASSFTKTAKFEYKTVVSGEAGIVLGLKVVGDMPEGVSVTLTEVE